MSWYQWTGCIGGNLALITLVPMFIGFKALWKSLRETWDEVQEEVKKEAANQAGSTDEK